MNMDIKLNENHDSDKAFFQQLTKDSIEVSNEISILLYEISGMPEEKIIIQIKEKFNILIQE